jgi:hypothetical protein
VIGSVNERCGIGDVCSGEGGKRGGKSGSVRGARRDLGGIDSSVSGAGRGMSGASCGIGRVGDNRCVSSAGGSVRCVGHAVLDLGILVGSETLSLPNGTIDGGNKLLPIAHRIRIHWCNASCASRRVRNNRP